MDLDEDIDDLIKDISNTSENLNIPSYTYKYEVPSTNNIKR